MVEVTHRDHPGLTEPVYEAGALPQLPDQPPLPMQTKLQVCDLVAQLLLSHSLLPLNVAVLLHVQLKAPHSLLRLHASPGCFGPTGPASGVVTGLPAHPPRALHVAGHTLVAVLHEPPEQGDAVTGFFPSLHAQTMGSQSPASLHFQPP